MKKNSCCFLIFLLVVVLLVTSCSKELDQETIKAEAKRLSLIFKDSKVDIIKNKNVPSDVNFSFSPNLLFEIKGDSEDILDTNQTFLLPQGFDTDSKENIFILDSRTNTIKKFDKNGEFIKSFGGRGDGPGEMSAPFSMAISRDTIYVADFNTNQVIKYDIEGNFVRKQHLRDGVPMHMKAVGDDRFIGIIIGQYNNNNDGNYTTYNLVLLNRNFETVRILNEYKVLLNDNIKVSFLEYLIPNSITDNEIFVSVNSDTKYKINVFDFDGIKKYSIEKSYRRLKFPDKELKMFDDLMLKKNNGQRIGNPLKAMFKKAINGMYHDKNGTLFVLPSVDRSDKNEKKFIVDAFDKNGVFLNQIKIDNLSEGYDFYNLDDRFLFKNGKIYYYKLSETFLKVYDY